MGQVLSLSLKQKLHTHARELGVVSGEPGTNASRF